MELPTDRPASAPVAAAARRVVLGFGVREIGIGALALAVLTAGGMWLRGHYRHNTAELTDVQQQIAAKADALEVYRDRIAALRWNSTQMRAWAESQSAEPLRTWARERAHRFEAFVARLDQENQARDFEVARKDIEARSAQGDLAGAKAELAQLPMMMFPGPTDLARLRHDLYEAPLAQFSRQNPDYYRAFRQHEPDAAKADEAQLRAEITRGGSDAVTPQLMLKVDLLAAVNGPDDPVVAEWAALASAMDYFDNPDPATIEHWRRAQKALKTQDWQSATSEMQSIVVSKVRTRQMFRAAFGRVLLKSRPDDPTAAYPFLAEAAATGDKQARAWVAQEDYKQRRFAAAKHWAESAVADGDNTTLPLLLKIYDQHADETPHDPEREATLLERVSDRPDAPAEASLLLGKMYERGDPPGSTKTKALACYNRAAAKGSANGHAEVARCAFHGIGTPENPDQALDEACQAFTGGEREQSVPILIELMRRAPEHAANAIERLFAQETVTNAAPYTETTIVEGPGVSQLKGLLAAYFDRVGKFNSAARFYAGARDAAASQRRMELTAMHVCETCGGVGKIQVSVPCPTCGGTGKQICSFCAGTGFIFVPGTPPCPTCGGAGTMVQDNKVVTCATCGGTGKGKGSVIRKDCSHCEHGYIRCTQCTNGAIKVTKDCPDCHGHGKWSLTERGE
jgi:TPR repeat protein